MAFFGYMEGALQSGIHAAQLIARHENVPEVEKIFERSLRESERLSSLDFSRDALS
jgi:hypothetical protein